MALRVFSWDANPKIDQFSYKVSDSKGLNLLFKRTHFKVKCEDGRTALQAYPPIEERQQFARYDQAWSMRPSGLSRILVWQLNT